MMDEIIKHRRLYQEGRPEITDEEYDSLLERYNVRDFSLPPSYGEKVKLPYYMGSVRKIKTSNDIEKWKEKFHGPYVIEDKINGVSGLYTCDIHGGRLYTKGNQTYGRDISEILREMSLPIIPRSYVVRGELVILESDFQHLADEGIVNKTNALNVISGSLNSKNNINDHVRGKMRFYAYRLYDSLSGEMDLSQQLEILREIGFNVPRWEKLNYIGKDVLSNKLEEYKDNALYDIDGIIIADSSEAHIFPDDSDPKHMVAYKENTIVKTSVRDIEWTARISSIYFPVVIVDPVVTSGVTINRISGHNARYVIDNKIGIGSEIYISRSGEIIPKIERVIVGSDDFNLPDDFIWQGDVNICRRGGPNEEEKISRFLTCIGVENFREKRVKQLVSCGMNLYDVINEREINCLGYSLDRSLRRQIDEKMMNVSPSDLMRGSFCFGSGLDRKLALIYENIPNFLESCDEERLMRIKGIGRNTAHRFMRNIDNFATWLDDMGLELPQSSSRGEIIVFSGFRDRKLRERLEEGGCQVRDAITRDTGMLIVKDRDASSSKISKARRYGIPIHQLDEI